MITREQQMDMYKRGIKGLTPKRMSKRYFYLIVADLLVNSWMDEMAMQWVEDLVRHIHKVDPKLFDTLPKELEEKC